MRLWLRLALAFTFVGVVPMLILAAFVVGELRDQADELALSGVEREAELYADRLGRWTQDQGRFLAGWARPYRDRLAGMDPELQSGLLNAVYVAMPSAMVVTLVDEDGVSVASPAFSEEALDAEIASGQRAELLVRRAPITEAVRAGDVVVLGSPYLPPGEEVLSVPVAVRATVPPARGGPQDALFLVAEVQLLELAAIQQAVTPDFGIALLGSDGAVIAGAEHPLVGGRALEPLAQIVDGLGTFRLATQPAVIGGMAPVAGTDWTLIIVRPAAAVEQEAARVVRLSRVFIAFGLALAIFLSWMLAQSLSEPVAKLRDMALAVSEGDYGKRTEVGGSDEIGELARAFNHMSARLAVNQKEIEEQHQQIVGFNEELQERVERRTRQLVDAQDQLVQSGQLAAVAEVGAGLAHELNNPLASILGAAQILRARSTDERQKPLLADLEAEAQRCREVVGAMLRFSSGEEVDPENASVVDLRDVLADVTTLVQGPFRQRGVTLELDMPDQPLPVRLDPIAGSRLLAQVLNGLRAGLTDGTTLGVTALLGHDEIEVVITPDYPVAIDEFRRDDWMASGMGLWVARRLLDQLGGRLEQPVKVPWVSGMRRPTTEELLDGEDPSLPLLSDATWRVFLPRA